MSYDTFKTPAEAKKFYKRCRTVKHFILDKAWIKKHDPVCGCGKKMSEHNSPPGYDGNRCKYLPRMKRIVIYNYECAWNNLLQKVFECKTY